jgi:4-carboxymuconolactone decarboxylase
MTAVAPEVRDALAGAAAGRLEGELALRTEAPEGRSLDPRTRALVRIAALVALDAPPASYAWQVGAAVDAGVEPEEILALLRAIAPEVGAPKVVAAAPEVMLALGLALPDGVGEDE